MENILQLKFVLMHNKNNDLIKDILKDAEEKVIIREKVHERNIRNQQQEVQARAHSESIVTKIVT